MIPVGGKMVPIETARQISKRIGSSILWRPQPESGLKDDDNAFAVILQSGDDDPPPTPPARAKRVRTSHADWTKEAA